MKLMVSYHYTRKTFDQGFGNCPVDVNVQELTMEVIREIEKDISDMYGYTGIVILNVVRLDA